MPRKRRGLTYKICEICSMGYTTARPDVSKYCERPACAQKAYRQRKAEKEAQAARELSSYERYQIDLLRGATGAPSAIMEFIEETYGTDALKAMLKFRIVKAMLE